MELGRKKAGEKDPENGYRCSKQYGLESIVIPATGGMACFRTRTSSGGLGEGYDLLVIDEAQEYTTAQETALVYVVSASQNPQTIFCGTPPTLVSAGTVFSNLRRDTLAGESYDTGWAEWSIDHDPEDITDPDLWYETNPSLGYHLSERAVRSEIRGDKLDFVIQRLGYWYQYSIKSEISRADWTALKCADPPELTGKLYIGVKFGVDGKNSAVSLAVRTTDGRIFVESLDCRPQRSGVDWITLMLSCMDIAEIVIDGKSGQSLLAQSLETEDLPAPILPTTAEVIDANATFTAALSAGEICHMGQPSLEEVACNTERRSIGTAGGYGYKSIKIDLDIALLDSVILAVWACSQDQSEPGDVFVVY